MGDSLMAQNSNTYMLLLLLFSHLVMSNSFVTPWTMPARLLCSWDFPGENTGVGCHFLLQKVFPTQRWNSISCIGRWIPYYWATREAQCIYKTYKTSTFNKTLHQCHSHQYFSYIIWQHLCVWHDNPVK